MIELEIDVVTRGPVFDGRAAAAVPGFLSAGADDVADEGREMVRDVAPHRTGYYRSRIRTERRGSGAVVTDGRVVYGPWLEGVSSRNQSTRFRGYRMFRQAARRLQRRVPAIIEPSLQRLVQKMGG